MEKVKWKQCFDEAAIRWIQVLKELKHLVRYRERYFEGKVPDFLALGLSSRSNLCIHPDVQRRVSKSERF